MFAGALDEAAESLDLSIPKSLLLHALGRGAGTVCLAGTAVALPEITRRQPANQSRVGQ
jgi:hypothetical protein